MSPKQEAFVREYLIDLNAASAYKRAGYTAKNINVAGVEGHRLLKSPKIALAIALEMQKRAQRNNLSADRVLLELSRLALSDARKLFGPDGKLKPVAEWDEDTAATVASLDAGPVGVQKVKLWDKNSALDKLCKHLGLYADESSNPAGNHLHIHLESAQLRKMPHDELRRLYLEALRAPAEAENSPTTGA